MASRKEFLEDGLLAQELAKREEHRLLAIKQINALRETADNAYIRYLDAQEKKLPSEQLTQLKIQSDTLQEKVTAEEKRIKALDVPTTNSIDFIQSRLGIAIENKSSISERKMATPLRDFSVSDMKLINEHYAKLPLDLQKLMNAASDESILLELTANPVFIRGEGHIYDIKTLVDLLARSEPAKCPLDQERKFTRADIIPCNSLIQAMIFLLDIIKGEVKATPAINKKLSTLLPSHARKRVSAEIVELIEAKYMHLPERHKVLFDAICRDPQSKIIMDDPVMLPDGYIYDRTTANAYLRIMGGQCPANPDIKFSEADITPCYFVVRVLDQLKDNIMEIMKSSAPAKAAPKIALR